MLCRLRDSCGVGRCKCLHSNRIASLRRGTAKPGANAPGMTEMEDRSPSACTTSARMLIFLLGIDDARQIVGQVCGKVIPKPSTLVLLGIGIVGLIGYKSERKRQ
jgi:hypothetical protein